MGLKKLSISFGTHLNCNNFSSVVLYFVISRKGSLSKLEDQIKALNFTGTHRRSPFCSNIVLCSVFPAADRSNSKEMILNKAPSSAGTHCN